MITSDEFLTMPEITKTSSAERLEALLWFEAQHDSSNGKTVDELCEAIERVGYAKQNRTRVRRALEKSPAALKGRGSTFRLNPRRKDALEAKYSPLLKSNTVKIKDGIVPLDLFSSARKYIQKVVYQLNASYEMRLYDCAAVMCRRLLETLIIEAYERQGIEQRIKDGNDHYFMLSGLIASIEHSNRLRLSRNSIQGLKDFKGLGDLSAHNRRYNARKSDIDKARQQLRVISEELLHLSGQAA